MRNELIDGETSAFAGPGGGEREVHGKGKGSIVT